MKKNIIFIILLLTLTFSLMAQNLSFNLEAGLSNPIGDFADEDYSIQQYLNENGKGLANKGFLIGVELNKKMNETGLYLSFGISYLKNSYNIGAIEDSFKDLYTSYGWNVNNYDVQKANWNIVPILAGIKFKRPFSETVSWYVSPKIGLSIITFPKLDHSLDLDYENEHREIEETLEADPTKSFTFDLSFGLTFKQKFNFGARYTNMFSPEFSHEYNAQLTENNTINFYKYEHDQKYKISTLNFVVGINF